MTEKKQQSENTQNKEEFIPFTKDWMFAAVTRDPGICKGLLEVILPDEDIGEIEMAAPKNPVFDEEPDITTQATLKFAEDVHGVRFDAYCKSKDEWYDVEMHTTAVSDELRYAGTVHIDESGRVGFFSQNVGGDSQTGSSFTSDKNGYVLLGETPILSKASYPYGLKAEVIVTMDEADKIFNAKVTVKSKNNTELSANEFQVKPIRRSSLEINHQ